MVGPRPPRYSLELNQEGFVALATYVLVAVLTIWLIHWLRILIDRLAEAQRRQELLIGELQHRSQNLFTVIQSIASRSLVEGLSPTTAREVFISRLHAIARAHRMLAEAAWTGAPLDQLLREELDAVSPNVSDIVINTPAAQQFAMIVHELATNALKYGALSSPNGRINIEGKTQQMTGSRCSSSGGTSMAAPRDGAQP